MYVLVKNFFHINHMNYLGHKYNLAMILIDVIVKGVNISVSFMIDILITQPLNIQGNVPGEPEIQVDVPTMCNDFDKIR